MSSLPIINDEKHVKSIRKITVINEQGDEFESMEALQSWETWAQEKLAGASQSSLVSHEAVMKRLDAFEKQLALKSHENIL